MKTSLTVSNSQSKTVISITDKNTKECVEHQLSQKELLAVIKALMTYVQTK